MNSNYGIRHHAVLYGLLVKFIFKYAGDNAKEIIEKLTRSYGLKRGQRMRKLAIENNEDLNINTFFVHGEWIGEEGENSSILSFDSQNTISTVSKCAWYDYWKEYDLLQYGPFYCRYIDKAVCEGFNGDFSLDLDKAIGLGDESCEFRWNEKYDKDYLACHPKNWILSFDFHCKELLETASEILDEDIRDKVLKDVDEEFEEIFNKQVPK